MILNCGTRMSPIKPVIASRLLRERDRYWFGGLNRFGPVDDIRKKAAVSFHDAVRHRFGGWSYAAAGVRVARPPVDQIGVGRGLGFRPGKSRKLWFVRTICHLPGTPG